MASKSTGIVRSTRGCSVAECQNKEAKHLDINFYRFPGRRGEEQRKELWIAAVNRLDKDGNPWRPNSNSRVCSVHFVGGKKSDDKNSPSYIPSIFPTIVNLVKTAEEEQDNKVSFASVEASSRPPLISEAVIEDSDGDCVEQVPEKPQVELREIWCQTDLWLDQPQDGPHILFCSINGRESSTQTDIIIPKFRPKSRVITEETVKQSVDKRSGPDSPVNPGFVGFEDIVTDTTFRELAGVSREFFLVLLSFITPGSVGQPKYFKTLKKENRLLLLLMKMKLGISFCALACLFHVSVSTASRIFEQVLETLTFNTKTWIFWPSRESVRANLPKSFHHYPTCRCIIDCTEISTDTPPTVEQRVLMYSSYESRFTIKFLIAITPDGLICKVSKGYGGRATDSYIANDSGFLNLIEPGDLVLADKEFPQIKSEISKRNATLVSPPLAFNPQFTESEIDETHKVASVRIHVERAIQKIKLFRILDHINIELLPYVDEIMHICCIVANSQARLIADD